MIFVIPIFFLYFYAFNSAEPSPSFKSCFENKGINRALYKGGMLRDVWQIVDR